MNSLEASYQCVRTCLFDHNFARVCNSVHIKRNMRPHASLFRGIANRNGHGTLCSVTVDASIWLKLSFEFVSPLSFPFAFFFRNWTAEDSAWNDAFDTFDRIYGQPEITRVGIYAHWPVFLSVFFLVLDFWFERGFIPALLGSNWWLQLPFNFFFRKKSIN